MYLQVLTSLICTAWFYESGIIIVFYKRGIIISICIFSTGRPSVLKNTWLHDFLLQLTTASDLLEVFSWKQNFYNLGIKSTMSM